VTLPGFATVKRDGIELTGSVTLTIPIELKVGELQETVTVTGASPVVDVQNTRRETVISADAIQALPATRAYGSLLNAMPGVTVDNNGLAATPTMTFFSAHGGRTNEGRMSINGMTVAAAFNGGGVSSLTYDTTNVEEVAMLVSGGLGENETGGPTMNLVPKSGGNKFSGQLFFNTAGDWSRGDNIDDALRDIGITKGPGIKSSYDASGSLGGPITRDRLWFFGSYRKYTTTTGVEGIGANKYAGDASHWDYLRDDSVEPRLVQGRDIWSARGTAQVTPRNRVTFSHEKQSRCEGSTLTPSGQGCRTRGADWIGLGATTRSPEADTGYFDFPYWVTQATWTSPMTSHLLLEAGYSRFAYRHAGGPGQVPPDGVLDLIPVTEQSAIDGHRANFVYRGLGTYSNNFGNPNSWRASASYVTGAHNMKAGYQGSYLVADSEFDTNVSQLAYRFLNHVPNQFTYRLPAFQTADRTKVAALFVQDTWTRNQLTLQAALRYDQASSFSPAEHNGTTQTSRFNAAPITLARTDGVSAYRDISPRFGLAYDVFGNGKTALKFNIGRYLAPATNDTIYTRNNPANGIVGYNITPINRSWTDTNGNYIVDCDILNPAQQVVPGGDSCGAVTGNSLNFGKPGTSTRVNPGLLKGWGVRPADSQWGINLQQELMPRVSLEVGYNRRYRGKRSYDPLLCVEANSAFLWDVELRRGDAGTWAGRGAARGQLRDLRNRLRSCAHQLLAGRRRHRERAYQGESDAPGRHDHRARDQRHVRNHREGRQPGPEELSRGRSGRDDASRPGVVHDPQAGRAGQRHRAVAAADHLQEQQRHNLYWQRANAACDDPGPGRRIHERAQHGGPEHPRASSARPTVAGHRSTCGSRKSSGSAAGARMSASISKTC